MTPRDILLYSKTRVLLSHPPRSFFLQQIGQRDPQTDVMQRVKDLDTLNSKWDVFIKSLPPGSGIHQKRREKEYKSQRVWKSPRKHSSINQQDSCTNELSETAAACTGPAQFCTRSSPKAEWRK